MPMRSQIIAARACAVATLVLFWVPAARAQCPRQWLPGEGGTGINGDVYASIEWDPDGDGPRPPVLVAGGSFSQAGGIAVKNIAAWDGHSWIALAGGVNGSVTELEVFGNALIVGGTFTKANGAPANKLAMWDGTSWTALNPGPIASVEALEVYHDRLLVGGAISEGGTSYTLGSFDGSAWTWSGAELPQHEFLDLKVIGGELYAGARFQSGISFYGRVLRWDGAAWQQIGPVMNGDVEAIIEYGGRLVAAGTFAVIDNVTTFFVAQWDGAMWQPLGLGPNMPVGHMQVFDGRLIVARGFTNISGIYSGGAWAWDGAAWAQVGPSGMSIVHSLTTFNGTLIAGGESIQGRHIARWDGTAWRSMGKGLDGGVKHLADLDGQIYAAGSFETADSVVLNHVARRIENGWEPLGTGLSSVSALRVFNGEIIAAAPFDNSNPGEGPLRRWDGAAWQFHTTGGMGELVALTEVNGELVGAALVGEYAGSLTKWTVKKWDGTSWQQLGEPITGTRVRALAEFNGEVVVAGWFSAAGATPLSNIARWNGAAWQSVGGGLPGVSAEGVFAMVPYNGELVVGGQFAKAGETDVIAIARWNGAQWNALGQGLGRGGHTEQVEYLAVHHGELLASGTFVRLSGQTSVGPVAAWDGSTWRKFDPAIIGAGAMLSIGDDFAIAGTVTPPGGTPTSSFSHFTTPNPAVIVSHPASAATCWGATITLAAQASGTGPFTYRWRRNGADLADGSTASGSILWGATASTLILAHATPTDSGDYDVVISNICSAATSDAAPVTVCLADVNCDSYVNGVDFDTFISAFEQGDPHADANADGFVNGADFDSFVEAFERGC